MTANGLEVPRDWWRQEACGVVLRLPSPVLELRLTVEDAELLDRILTALRL